MRALLCALLLVSCARARIIDREYAVREIVNGDIAGLATLDHLDEVVEIADWLNDQLGFDALHPTLSPRESTITFVDLHDMPNIGLGFQLLETTAHVQHYRGYIVIDRPYWNAATKEQRRVLLLHEMGHAWGLKHQPGVHDLMNPVLVKEPDWRPFLKRAQLFFFDSDR
jgi:hypothetical protein